MPKKKRITHLTAHAFSIVMLDESISLESHFEALAKNALKDRLVQLSGGLHRIDILHKVKKGLWHIEFAKFREGHGPSAGTRNEPPRGLGLNSDEEFIEHAAVIFDLKKSYMIVQFNNVGPRSGSIVEVLAALDTNNLYNFMITPKYDDEKISVFENRKETKSFTFRLDTREFTSQDRKTGKALWSMIDMAEKTGGDIVDVTISAGRSNKNFLNNAATKVLNILRQKAEDNPYGVKKLQAQYLKDYDKKLEVIDLLSDRLFIKFDAVPIGDDKRIAIDVRFKFLEIARHKWKKHFK